MWWRVTKLPVEGLLTMGFTLSFVAAVLLGALPLGALLLAVATIAVFRRSTKLGLLVGLTAIFAFMVLFVYKVASMT